MTITLCGSIIRYRGDDVAQLLIPEGGKQAGDFASALGGSDQILSLQRVIDRLETRLDDSKQAIRRALWDLERGSNKAEALLLLKGFIR